MQSERRWLTIKQTSDLLQISLKGCYRLVSTGQIKATRLGARILRVDGLRLREQLEGVGKK